ncbi:MAG TPA: TetR/AcrR family transcriptional regulator [Myxococcaceae bacterium]
MARRKTQRPRDAMATREVLLDAATLVFAEQGFAGARVDEIATRAGVNKALIYAYYGDKKGLYRAVLGSRVSEFADPAFSQALAKEAGPRRALEDLIRRFFRTLIKDRAYARLLAWELLSHGREGREVILESSGPLMDLVADLVRRARSAGELPTDHDPDLFRAAFISLAVGYAVQHSAMVLARSREGIEVTDEQFVDYACHLLLEPPNPRRDRRSA